MRREFLDGKIFDSIADAQAQLDIWVRSYNEVREHQSIGNVPPVRRFELRTITADSPKREAVQADPAGVMPAGVMPAGATRRVSRQGTVSFGAASYFVARQLAGEEVVLVIDRKLVQIHHRGVLVATHARHDAPPKKTSSSAHPPNGPEADSTEPSNGDNRFSNPEGRFIRESVVRRAQLQRGERSTSAAKFTSR